MNNYYSGGLAELIPHPTPLTYSFFSYWFTGLRSLGLGMRLLGLPYSPVDLPVLSLLDGEMFVDLEAEEKTLYSQTLFSYNQQPDTNSDPSLHINSSQLFHPSAYFGTVQVLLAQSRWIASPEAVEKLANRLLDSIPSAPERFSLEKTDQTLANDCWPVVIALGALAEFFHQLIIKDKNTTDQFWNQTSQAIAQQDWFFQSLVDQIKVQQGEMKIDSYLKEYGLRADLDYELDSPRWQENPVLFKRRLFKHKIQADTLHLSESRPVTDRRLQTYIKLQAMRSQARKKILPHFAQLRWAIIKEVGLDTAIKNITRGELVGVENIANTIFSSPLSQKSPVKFASKGIGRGVSAGIAEGVALRISDNQTAILEDTIGIFPNATPEFTTQFPQCSGIIFLSGGQTSHGAIVAREFSIPALVDASAKAIPNGSKVRLNGQTGQWEII